MALYLKENLTFDAARMEVITEDHTDGKGGKNLYMKGICIQGGCVWPINPLMPRPRLRHILGS